MVAWFITGNVWYYATDENCASGEIYTDFYEGHLLTQIILIVYYAMLGSALCAGFLLIILISIGSGLTNKSDSY